MTDNQQQPEHSFLRAASAALQEQQGFYPAEVAAPELDEMLTDFDVRLVQTDTYGRPSIMLMSVLSEQQREQYATGELRVCCLAAVTEALRTFRPESEVRVSVVLISPAPLSVRQTRRQLRRERISRGFDKLTTPSMSRGRPLQDVGFYWVSPRTKSFQSGYRFFSLAANSALNPCNPEPNVFTRLLRRGWGRVEGPPPTDQQTCPPRRVRQFLEERSFSEKLLTRPTAVWGFLVVNLLIWYLTEWLGGSKNIEVLIRCGAKVDGLIGIGQYWRLVTPTFLHAGYAHMAINGLALMVLGQTLERLYGSVRFALAYVLCGIVAAFASMLVGHGVMVGASGAIFGIVGVLVVYGFRYRRDIPPRYQAMFGAGLLPLVGLNVLLGFLIPQIDNAAHIGGLLAGAGMALVLRPRTAPQPGKFRHWVRRVAFVIIGGTVLASGFMAATFFRTYPDTAAIDSQFVIERRFGPVGAQTPATWTIRRTSPERWELVAGYCTARVEVVPTREPLDVATRRCVERFSNNLGEPVFPPAAVVAALMPLLERDGRARFAPIVRGRPLFPRLTFVAVTDDLAELAITPAGQAAGGQSKPGLVRILRRMEDSFGPVVPER